MSKPLILCARVADCSDPIPGVTQAACAECGQPVWLSRSSLALGEATLICNYCAHWAIQKYTPAKTVQLAMTDAGIDEIIQHEKRN